MFLNGHSWFSLRYGVLSPKKLVEMAAEKGIRTLALTDLNNTSGALEFVSSCERAGIRPILGIEFRRDGRLLFVGLARSREGFFHLNRLLTDHSLDSKTLPDCCPTLPETFIIYPRLVKPIELFEENEFLGVRPCQVAGLYSSSWKKRLDKLVVFSPITAPDAESFR
ncbi:MAG: PHP domain-containing protein, partial [Saprospiraceae bacterium]